MSLKKAIEKFPDVNKGEIIKRKDWKIYNQAEANTFQQTYKNVLKIARSKKFDGPELAQEILCMKCPTDPNEIMPDGKERYCSQSFEAYCPGCNKYDKVVEEAKS